jgi:hypothetical protein
MPHLYSAMDAGSLRVGLGSKAAHLSH